MWGKGTQEGKPSEVENLSAAQIERRAGVQATLARAALAENIAQMQAAAGASENVDLSKQLNWE